MGRSNFGTPERSGCTGLNRTRQLGAAATISYKQNSRSNLRNSLRGFNIRVTGRANYVISARMGAKSPSKAVTSFSVTVQSLKSIAILLKRSKLKSLSAKLKNDCAG